MIPLRFLQCWNGYDRGSEVPFPHVGLGHDLIRWGIAEEVKPATVSPTPETGTGTPASPTPEVPPEPTRRPARRNK